LGRRTVDPFGGRKTIMNRWISLTKRTAIWTALAAAAAMAPAGVAWAQGEAADGAPAATSARGHRPFGLLRMAEQLDSLGPDQRTAIEQITANQRAGLTPLRQANAAVLTTLAQQVESGAIDRSALAPSVQARNAAGLAARSVHRDALQKLHDTLTPDQRGQLVDALEARAHEAPGAWRDGGARGEHPGRLGAMAERLGLSPAQRQQIVANFRAERASEEAGTASAAGAGHDAGGAHAQHAAARLAWLEAFRGDGFQAGAMSPADLAQAQAAIDRHADRIEDWLQAAVPVLTPAQRTTLAAHLRQRASHES
jgi:Spy/CpxP family protein refolding chaperone